MKSMLITGGAGFIGSHCIDRFSDEFEIVVADDLSSGKRSNVENKNVNFYDADIRNTEEMIRIIKKHRVTHILHFAACVSVARSVEEPLYAEMINSVALAALLEKAAPLIECFLLASSAAVYGESPELPKVESMTPEPMSPYAITKVAGEQYNRYFARIHGYRPVNLRFFNVFGPRQDPASHYAAAVPIFMTRALDNLPITIYGDGEQTRDFIYVEDLTDAIAYLLKKDTLVYDTYNIGYGTAITINEIVRQICSMASSSSQIAYAPERTGEIRHSYSSVNRLMNEGWKPLCGFEKGLSRTFDFFSGQRAASADSPLKE